MYETYRHCAKSRSTLLARSRASRRRSPGGHYDADRSSPLRHSRSHHKPFILAENCRKGAENGGFIGQMRARRIFGIGWWVGGGRLELLRDGGAVVPPPLGPGSTPSTKRATSPRP